MKTKCIRMDWLIPFVGIALVAATLAAMKGYLDLEQGTEEVVAFNATLGRLHQDRQISLALKEIQAGKAEEAAQRLDLMLCGDIILTDSELASADGWQRELVTDVFRGMALIRPSIAQRGGAGSAQARTLGQIEAERVLSEALGIAHTAQTQ